MSVLQAFWDAQLALFRVHGRSLWRFEELPLQGNAGRQLPKKQGYYMYQIKSSQLFVREEVRLMANAAAELGELLDTANERKMCVVSRSLLDLSKPTRHCIFSEQHAFAVACTAGRPALQIIQPGKASPN